MRRAARSVGFTALAAVMLVVPLSGVAAAGQGSAGSGDGSGGGSGGKGKREVLATLRIENPSVEVKAKGADEFEPATDGQELRQGDTVRTDETGRAEVDYGGDWYTRLDVDTTFKIVKLSEDEGKRQVEGGLESGRTWNRAENVTQSGSFEQSGGGATAAVTGTAFPVECFSDTEECVFTGVVGTYVLRGDGEERTIEPLDQCDADAGVLCGEVTELTEEELAAIAWIQENLLRDLLERGLGPGPFVVGGTLIIEDGVITFEETPQPTPPPSSTTTTTTTTTQPKPTVADPPIDCEVWFGESGDSCDYADIGAAWGPTSEIVVYESDEVVFQVRVEENGATDPVSVVFDELPANVGTWCVEDGDACDLLQTGVEYGVDSFFWLYATYCEEVSCDDPFATGTLRFHLRNAAAGDGPQASVPVAVRVYDLCSAGDVVTGCGAETATDETSPTTASTSPPTTAPSTTTTAEPVETTSTTTGQDG